MPRKTLMDGNMIAERAAELIETEIDGDLVALDVQRGTCFGFNATASRVWQLLDPAARVSDVVDRLTAEFAVERAECAGAVEGLLTDLERRGLVRLRAA